MANWKKLAQGAAGAGGAEEGLDVTDVFNTTLYMGHGGNRLSQLMINSDSSDHNPAGTAPQFYWWSATFSPEGDKCFIGGRAGNSEIHEYTCKEPFDLSTGYVSATFDFSSQVSNCECVKFSADGTVMFIGSYVSDAIYQYTLSTAFDVSTASYANKSLDLTVQDSQTNMRAMDFKSDGTKVYIFETSRQHVREYSLSTAWDISTAGGSTTSPSLGSSINGGCISPDGTKFYVTAANSIREYTMGTAFNAATCGSSYTRSTQVFHTTVGTTQSSLNGDLGLTQVDNRLFMCVIDDGRQKLASIYLTDPNDLQTHCNQYLRTGVDLETDGGLIWIKQRDGGNSHVLYDSERNNFGDEIRSDSRNHESSEPNAIKVVTTDGFGMGNHTPLSTTGKFVAWSFKKEPKFLDIINYTGDATAGRTLSHNLGCDVGAIFFKKVANGTTKDWAAWFRGMGNGYQLVLNSPNAKTGSSILNYTDPTSTTITLGNNAACNQSGGEYIAYVFAHNDNNGRFGINADEDVIKCGTYTGTGSSDKDSVFVDLGFEPDFLLIKNTTDGTEWIMADNKRAGISAYQLYYLTPRSSDAETSSTGMVIKLGPKGFGTWTGSNAINGQNYEYVYMAIRKGPIKPPTNGVEIMSNQNYGSMYRRGFAPWKGDIYLNLYSGSNSNQGEWRSRLMKSKWATNINYGEQVDGTSAWVDFNDGYGDASQTSDAYHPTMFRRMSGFLEEVFYIGDGQSSQAIDHGLKATPEMIWVKNKDGAEEWRVYHKDRAGTGYSMRLDTSSGEQALADFPSNPTDTQFTVGSNSRVNGNGGSYVAWLFGTVDGVCKIGSYTGNASSQTINAGLSKEPRFVMIKEMDIQGSGAGSWWVFNSLLGLQSSGSLEAVKLDLTSGTTTSASIKISTTSSGFSLNTTYDELNENGKKYLYWAIT